MVDAKEEDGVRGFVVDHEHERMVGDELRVEEGTSGSGKEICGHYRSLLRILLNNDFIGNHSLMFKNSHPIYLKPKTAVAAAASEPSSLTSMKDL